MRHMVELLRLGRVTYGEAQALQEDIARRVAAGDAEALLLMEIAPVYTLGRRAAPEHLLASREEMVAMGAELVETDRGGDVTFHGPGQLVGYPVLNLRPRGMGPVDYVRALEESVIETLASFGQRGERISGRPGVWLDGSKVAAIGVRASRGVTTHGFALNVHTDLQWFDAIIPCGIRDAGVTSMRRALGRETALEDVEEAYCEAFSAVFESSLSSKDSPSHRGEPAAAAVAAIRKRGAGA